MLQHLLILGIAIGFLTLVGQQIADHHSKDNESFRKLFHVIHALALVGLAFVVPLQWIIGLEVLFFVSTIITRYLVVTKSHLLKAVGYLSRAYKVGRVSYGEFFYPISIIILVLLAHSKWEFAASVLILGLADTAAAIIGKKYGKHSSYKILGQKKSPIGSLAFFTVCFFIIAGFVSVAPLSIQPGLLYVLSVTLLITISENLGVYGSDNLFIPIVAVLLLNAM